MENKLYLVTEYNGGEKWLFNSQEEATKFISWYLDTYYKDDASDANIECETIQVLSIAQAKENAEAVL